MATDNRKPPVFRRDGPSDLKPLPIADLVAIWRSLPEAKRASFLVSLEEDIGDRLLAAAMPPASPAPDPWRSTPAELRAWIDARDRETAAQPKPKPAIRLDDLTGAQLAQVASCSTEEQVNRLLEKFSKE